MKFTISVFCGVLWPILLLANIGDVIITEIMYDDASGGADSEYVEIHNITGSPIDISGWYLSDDDSYPAITAEGGLLVPDGTILPANGYLVLADNQYYPAAIHCTKFGSYALGNSGDNLALYSAQTGGTLIDGSFTVAYPDLSPSNTGASIEKRSATAPWSGSEIDWKVSTNLYASSGRYIYCSPGAENADDILSVELSAFNAYSVSEGIRLSFSLASETNNDHFEIWRSDANDEEFTKIAEPHSKGNSASGNSYEYLDSNVSIGQTYWYYLTDVDVSGNRTEHRDLICSATAIANSVLPTEYSLTAYPNPFNPLTTISFSLPEEQRVRLAVFDVNGRMVKELANTNFRAGQHQAVFIANNLPTGIYFARIESAKFVKSEKLLLLK